MPLTTSGPFPLLLPYENTLVDLQESISCVLIIASEPPCQRSSHHRHVPVHVSTTKWWGKEKRGGWGEKGTYFKRKRMRHFLDRLFFNVSSFDAACNWSQLHQLFVRLEGERERKEVGRLRVSLSFRVMSTCGYAACVVFADRRSPGERRWIVTVTSSRSSCTYILKSSQLNSFRLQAERSLWQKKTKQKSDVCFFLLWRMCSSGKHLFVSYKSPTITNSSLYINHHVEDNVGRKFSHAL